MTNLSEIYNKGVRIFIIGPMASGKSMLGRKLSEHLNLPFIDTDKEIEKRAGAEVSWIFEKEGEKGFRSRESIVLKECSLNNQFIISTGGGTILKKENREIMKDRGKVIYLEAPIEVQLSRTLNDKSRPLIDNKDKKEVLERLHFERTHIYEQLSDIKIDYKERTKDSLLFTALKCMGIKT